MNLESSAEYLQSAAAAVAATRLFQLGLGRRQPALLAFLIFNCLYFSGLASFNPISPNYFYTFMFGTGLNVLISIAAVREMFALTFERYPGIRAAGRRVMYGATAVSAVCAMALTAYFNRGGTHSDSHLYFVEILDRSIVFSLGVVVIAILVTLSHYPLDLSRNTYISTIFFSSILLSEALQLLIDSLNAHLFSSNVDLAQVGFAVMCLIGWSCMLRVEALSPVRRVVFGTPHETELLRQLESLNRLLSNVGRK